MTFKQTVLQELLSLMRHDGIAHLTEQQIIAQVGISSATFREFFNDMNDVVDQILQFDLEMRTAQHEELFKEEPNSLKRLLLMVQQGLENLKQTKPSLIMELIQQYPEAWTSYWINSNEYSTHLVHELINEGILNGDLRKDINIQLVTKILIEQLSMLMNPAIFPPEKYDTAELFRSIFLYYIRGLCADKGMKIADDFFSSAK